MERSLESSTPPTSEASKRGAAGARSQIGARQERVAATCFLMPNLLGFLTFTFLPVLAVIALSLTEWDPVAEPISHIHFVGLSNFGYLLGFHRESGALVANDPDFWNFTWNTLFLMLAIPISMMLSLGLALALNQKLRGIAIFRAAFFAPSVAAGVGTMILWVWLLNPQYGLINTVLGYLGVTGPGWLQDYAWAKPGLMLMNIATTMGGTNMVIYLAALQDVPGELYEAATIDGAGNWAKFRYVTWPAILPITFFLFVIALIEGFQGGFDLGYVMTQGGPDGSTTTLSYYIWSEAFRYFHMGYAATIAVVLLAIISLAAAIVWRLGGDAVRPEGR